MRLSTGRLGKCLAGKLHVIMVNQHHDKAPVIVCQVPGTHMHALYFGVLEVFGVQDTDR
ncbi:hypothetical protein M3J09_012808 [Ascochyta lentis]